MSSVIGDILVVKNVNSSHALSSAEFNQICRCCLIANQIMYPIFKLDFNGSSFTELLKRCSSLKIEKNDRFPQNVCAICLKKVIEFHSFKEQCTRSETVLKDVIRREFLAPRLSKYPKRQKIIVSKEEIKTIDENCFEAFDSRCKYEEIVVDHDYSENLSPVCVSEIDIVKEEVSESPEYKPNIDDVVLEDVVRKKSRKPQIKKKVTVKNVKHFKPIALPKISVKNPQKIIQRRKSKCRVCEAVFESKEDFRAHREKENHVLQYLCKVCGAFVICGEGKAHMKTHAKLKLYECDICLKRFGYGINLKRHKMLHTNIRPHKCRICEKAFIQKVALRAHLRTHRDEKPFICQHCDKTFIYKGSLRTHLFHVHSEEIDDDKVEQQNNEENNKNTSAKLQCDTCQKIFFSKSSLRSHQLLHGEKNFICNQCGKGFYRQITLQIHQRLHTGEKPHQCTVCLKRFMYTTSLKSHSMTHTGVKPHVCKVCKKAFRQETHLKYHMRTHTSERPYVCNYCGKKFASNGNLTVHVRTHTGKKTYVCDVCGKGFHNAFSRRKHKLSQCIDD